MLRYSSIFLGFNGQVQVQYDNGLNWSNTQDLLQRKLVFFSSKILDKNNISDLEGEKIRNKEIEMCLEGILNKHEVLSNFCIREIRQCLFLRMHIDKTGDALFLFFR